VPANVIAASSVTRLSVAAGAEVVATGGCGASVPGSDRLGARGVSCTVGS
jgi:hypothetical protein